MKFNRGKTVTLLDVAERAGVSRMTVSKVMRGTGSISEETRNRIKQAADDLGYLPNSLAGALSSRISVMVAVIIPSVSDIVFSEVLSGINAVLRPKGIHTFIGESFFDPRIEADLVRAMLSLRPAGLLMNGGTARNPETERLLANRTCPAIQLWDCDAPDLDFSAGPSHEEAGRLVANHFLERGLRRIGYIGSELGRDICARRRFLALRETLAAGGAHLEPVFPDDMPRQAATGRALTEALLGARPETQAIHYLNDAMALGGLSHLHEIGIRVPEQVSVVGFNGTSIPNAVRTRLTTVDVPKVAIGEVAARALLDTLGATNEPRFWRAPLRLVQGNTTSAVAARNQAAGR